MLLALGFVAGIAVLVWLAVQGSGDEGPIAQPVTSASGDPLGAELRRCNDLGAAALDDTGCKRAWAESRRRFLGEPQAPGGESESSGAPSSAEAR